MFKSYYDRIKCNKSWSEIIEAFTKLKEKVITPRYKYKKLYDDMVLLYEKYENFVLHGGENPEQHRQKFIELYFKANNWSIKA